MLRERPKMKVIDKVKDKKTKKTSGAITQKNIEESREEILAKGKKFKYPFQYAKHRLMINAIAIGIVAVGTFVAIGAFQLYAAQNTSEVMYRFTRVFGLSVADVDGVKVRFSDYLMLYRSSVASVERQQGAFDDSDTSKEQKEYYKRQALTSAEDYSYAMAKLEKAGKGVTEAEIDEVIDEHRIIDGEKRSNEAFEGIIHDNFGLSIKEYRRLIALSLAKKKASIEFDKDAKSLSEQIFELTLTEKNFEKIMEAYKGSEALSYEIVEGVETSNLDSGRAVAAMKLENVGDISEPFASKNGDGYYIVKLLGKNDGKVSYASIGIRFRQLDNEMTKLRKDGKIHERIDLKMDDLIEASENEKVEENPEAEKSEK